jgi:hypothetical protein
MTEPCRRDRARCDSSWILTTRAGLTLLRPSVTMDTIRAAQQATEPRIDTSNSERLASWQISGIESEFGAYPTLWHES